jgi:hypothetical protein
MPHILHIMTQAPDDRPEDSGYDPALSEADATHSTSIFDLSSPSPDYDALLAAVFNADAVHVW